MAEYIEVDITALGRDVAAMQEKVREIQNGMKGMFDIYKELDSMWDGPANQSFVEQTVKDENRFKEVTDALYEILGSMDNAKESYTACENEVGDIIASINV